jgi:hypothetical protein
VFVVSFSKRPTLVRTESDRSGYTAMSNRSASEIKAREHDADVISVAELVGSFHCDVPKEFLEDIAEKALEKTEDAPVQGFRMLLAQHDVTGQAVAWERSHGGEGH